MPYLSRTSGNTFLQFFQCYENVINDKSVSIKETRKCFDIYNDTKRQLEEELNNIRTLL